MFVDINEDIEYKGKTYNVTGEARVYRDLYGADADGRRGEWRWEVDELSLAVTDEDDNVIECNEDIEDIILDRLFDRL